MVRRIRRWAAGDTLPTAILAMALGAILAAGLLHLRDVGDTQPPSVQIIQVPARTQVVQARTTEHAPPLLAQVDEQPVETITQTVTMPAPGPSTTTVTQAVFVTAWVTAQPQPIETPTSTTSGD